MCFKVNKRQIRSIQVTAQKNLIVILHQDLQKSNGPCIHSIRSVSKIIKHLKKWKISRKGMCLVDHLDKVLLDLLSCACIKKLEKFLPSRLWLRKLFKSNRFMFNYYKMSSKFWEKSHIQILSELLI